MFRASAMVSKGLIFNDRVGAGTGEFLNRKPGTEPTLSGSPESR